MSQSLQIRNRVKTQPQVSAWSISNGSLEALKWVGLLLMTGDHVNKYMLHESSPTLYALGRMVMPLFGFVLMAHLARPGARERGVHLRVMGRLAIFALLATPAFVHLVEVETASFGRFEAQKGSYARPGAGGLVSVPVGAES